MNTDIANIIASTDKEAQYDASAKRLLSHKLILAHILVKAVADFKAMNPIEVASLIIGEPYISKVPVEPGMTNSSKDVNTQSIRGFSTECEEINEGLVRFDIIFYVYTKDGTSQIIINIEAQKDEPTKYSILNRAIFYVSRLISSQKQRDFENSRYDDIKTVYSIWICMNTDKNTLSHIHLTKDDLIGHHNWRGNLDLLNIIMIGLGKELAEHDEMYELHHLLGALLSKVLTLDEKLDIIENEYNIPIEDKMRKDVNVMCNLSQGIKEDGIIEGIAIGESRGIAIGESKLIKEMHKNGLSVNEIAKIANKDISEIENILSSETALV